MAGSFGGSPHGGWYACLFREPCGVFMSVMFNDTAVAVEGTWRVDVLFHPAISSARMGEILHWIMEAPKDRVSLWLVDLATSGRATLVAAPWVEVSWLVMTLQMLAVPVEVVKEAA